MAETYFFEISSIEDMITFSTTKEREVESTLDILEVSLKENSALKKNDATIVIQESNRKLNDEFEINNELFNVFEKRPVPKYLNYQQDTQTWICYVVEIAESTFTAKLIDKNDNSTYEYAEFNIDDISKSDRELLSIGAVFYWSIFKEYKNGQITRQSLVRFRRSVKLPDGCIFDNLMDEASDLYDRLKWE